MEKTKEIERVNERGGVQNHITHASGNRKTVCSSAVLAYLGIPAGTYHYSGTIFQMINVLRSKGFSVRSRESRVRGMTVGQARSKIMDWVEGGHYVIQVQGHAILMNCLGETVRDTDPRKADRRKIIRIYHVTK